MLTYFRMFSFPRHALVVIDNQNLKDIWDFDKHPVLAIEKGHVFFHYNRKLCLHLIDKLIEMSGISGTDSDDVNRETNGDLIPCKWESQLGMNISINQRPCVFILLFCIRFTLFFKQEEVFFESFFSCTHLVVVVMVSYRHLKIVGSPPITGSVAL